MRPECHRGKQILTLTLVNNARALKAPCFSSHSKINYARKVRYILSQIKICQDMRSGSVAVGTKLHSIKNIQHASI